MNRFHLIIAILALVAVLSYWRRKDLINVLGVVSTPPAELASSDGVTVDVESLARVGQSEEFTETGRIAVMWTTKNMAAKRAISITGLVTSAKHHKPGEESVTESYDGLYTRDIAGKFCSTYQTPSQDTLALAAQVISGDIADPTGGATHWLSVLAWGGSTERSFFEEGLQHIEVSGVIKTRFYG